MAKTKSFGKSSGECHPTIGAGDELHPAESARWVDHRIRFNSAVVLGVYPAVASSASASGRPSSAFTPMKCLHVRSDLQMAIDSSERSTLNAFGPFHLSYNPSKLWFPQRTGRVGARRQ
jgi:hypothetical protein